MQDEQKRILRSLVIPGIFVLIMWLVKIFEIIFHTDLGVYGLAPLTWQGLPGILFAPLLHANFSHLSANTLPFFFLGGLLFYFYRSIAWKIFWLIWLTTGLWVWFFARGDSVHVGASGVVYGLASFLFLSGILRRESKLMAITLLIAFLYGGLVWGIFPQLFPHQPISWESHLMGLLAGAVLAVYYRNSGPQSKVYDWENEEEEGEDEDENENEEENNDQGPDDTGQSGGPKFNYEYKE
ncbi:MAG TPA: rhomboid family intramembrane serine protease [Bacteroidales bacterium]|nr:rhomboid family intramembrane serine protease [Bacteroidales bacterium]